MLEIKPMIEGTSFITRSRTPNRGPAAIATHIFLVGYRVIVDAVKRGPIQNLLNHQTNYKSRDTITFS